MGAKGRDKWRGAERTWPEVGRFGWEVCGFLGRCGLLGPDLTIISIVESGDLEMASLSFTANLRRQWRSRCRGPIFHVKLPMAFEQEEQFLIILVPWSINPKSSLATPAQEIG